MTLILKMYKIISIITVFFMYKINKKSD